MTAPAASGRPGDFEQFRLVVAPVLDVPVDGLDPTDRLGHEVELDEISLAALVLALQDVNPYFALPDQLAVDDLTVGDLFHLCCVRGPGHVEPADGGP